MKKIIKSAIEKAKVPIYGCVDNYSSLEFVWNYTKSDSLDMPCFVLVNGDNNVKIYNGVRTKSKVNSILKAAKKIGAAMISYRQRLPKCRQSIQTMRFRLITMNGVF